MSLDRFKRVLPQARLNKALFLQHAGCFFLVDRSNGFKRDSFVVKVTGYHRDNRNDPGQWELRFFVLFFSHLKPIYAPVRRRVKSRRVQKPKVAESPLFIVTDCKTLKQIAQARHAEYGRRPWLRKAEAPGGPAASVAAGR